MRFLLLLLCVFLLSDPLGQISSSRLVSASDLDALISLKNGFNDPHELATWNQTAAGAPCLGWRGVTCKNGTVVSITLPGVFKGGQISSAINRLQNLTSLDLSGNQLTGSLPEKWNMTNLQMLTLTANFLNGSIPGGLSEAVKLLRLRLEDNNFSGIIPPQLTSLPHLKYLAVEHNNLTGQIPQDLGRLTSLHSFYAAYNHLDGPLPDSIGSMTRLLHFEVESNRLSGLIPASIGDLSASLLTLNLSDNGLMGQVPTALSRFNVSSFENNPGLCGIANLPNCASFPGVLPPRSQEPGESGNSMRRPTRRESPGGRQTGKIVGGVVGGVVGAFALLVLLLLLLRRSNATKEGAQVQNWFSPDIQDNRRKGKFEMFGSSFRYTYEEIVANAGYFDTAHVLGKGRLATVYRSSLPDGTELAVKVFKYANIMTSFEKEIRSLASLQHQCILAVRGFYSNPVETAIFYDYLPGGTLYDLLHGQDNASDTLPDWSARYTIALGVAKALAYLHRGSSVPVVHKDVKSTNILLEKDFLPRLSDVGLMQAVSSKPNESVAVVETPGYTAPEVVTTKRYSEKGDAYSYGVVLLELITGKKAVSYVRERAVYLTEWVTRLSKEKRGREAMDAVAVQTCPMQEYLDKVFDLAVLCIDVNPNLRPSMSEVASILEGLALSPSPLRSPEMRPDRPFLP